MFTILNRNIGRTQNALDLSRLICNLSLESLEEQAHVYFKKLHPFATNDEISKLVLGELILKGDVVNGVISNPLAVEAPEEYTNRFKENVSFIFRGSFKHSDGKYYRPYAYIENFGFPDIFCSQRQQIIAKKALDIIDYSFDDEEDIDDEKNIGEEITKVLFKDIKNNFNLKKVNFFKNKTKEERGLHYANTDEDLCIVLDNNVFKFVNSKEQYIAFLFEEIEDCPPSFFNVCKTPEEAVLYFCKDNECSLKVYGHNSYCEVYSYFKKYNQYENVQFNILCELYSGKPNLINAVKDVLEFHLEKKKREFFDLLKNRIISASKIDQYGYIQIKSKDGELLAKAPYLPFAHWALRPINERKTLPDYIAQSPSGLKMPSDDPFHSDWMIGADLDLYDDYKGEIQDVANELRFRMQNLVRKADFLVLSNGGVVNGKVKFCTPDNAHEVEDGDIVVIPNGNIEYQLHVERAIKSGKGGVICEIANRVAHLVKVSRERQVTMMQMNYANFTIRDEMIVTLNPNNGTIKVL